MSLCYQIIIVLFVPSLNLTAIIEFIIIHIIMYTLFTTYREKHNVMESIGMGPFLLT